MRLLFDVIRPTWSAPSHVKAYSTTRVGGVSTGCYASLNLGLHVGDDEAKVLENRHVLEQALDMPSSPAWLEQIHGTSALPLSAARLNCSVADASYTYAPNVVSVVMTADCLPVLLTNKQGTCVAAIHAGWRGLVAGVIESTVESMRVAPNELIAWLGPAIGPGAFEVGEEVVEAFVRELPEAQAAFKANNNNAWLADIYLLARQRLNRLSVSEISGGEYCTYSDASRFFSYRRDGVTGRMATLIWMQAQ